jgi:hypothetical protein
MSKKVVLVEELLNFRSEPVFNKEAHKKKWEPKLWIMFDRARNQRPKDSLLAWAILQEIDRLNDSNNPYINQGHLQSCRK